MLKKILVPLDGSSMATVSLPHVTALGQTSDTQITLLHVLEPVASALTSVNPLDWHLQRTEAQAYLNEVACGLANHMLAPIETVVLEGRAADQIVDYARRAGFDLVVLSSHGQGGLTGWNLSSVTSKVIDRVGTSIMLVRADSAHPEQVAKSWTPVAYKRVLLPLDGSLRAEYVLPVARALAEQHGAELVLIHVVGQPELIQRLPFSPEQQALMEQFIEQNQTQAIKYLDSMNIRFDVPSQVRVLTSPNVAAALHDFAARETIDLVLMTAHGNSGLCQWPYGSLAYSMLVYGTTPVMVLQDLSSQGADQPDLVATDDAALPLGVRNQESGHQTSWHDQVGRHGFTAG